MHFELNEVEQEAADKWLKKHRKRCKLKGKTGAIGGAISYEFTLTGIGTAVEVKCACGEYKNVTDYGCW